MNTATTTAGLNLRSGAGTKNAIVLVIPGGETVTITGDPWYPVTYNGKTGWVSGAYLDFTQPDQTPHEVFAEGAMALAVSKLDAWYRWGGNGPDRFDCSGFVGWVLHTRGYQPGNKPLYHYSADQMFDNFRTGVWEAQKIEPGEERSGDLVFYGSTATNAGHVVFAVGDGRVLGASGGNDTVTNDDIAKARNAKVRYDTLRYHSNPIVGIYRPKYR
jgi:cell wall-associated NlpC family hydrolase